MRRMTLSRLGVGAVLSTVILTLWLGACSNGDEACGINGNKNGICRQGPTCPSGSSLLLISNPPDECPQGDDPTSDYVCCVSGTDAGTASTPAPAAAVDSGTSG